MSLSAGDPGDRQEAELCILISRAGSEARPEWSE